MTNTIEQLLAEQAQIPDLVRAAFANGDTEALERLRERKRMLPDELAIARVEHLKARIEQAEQQASDLQESVQALNSAVDERRIERDFAAERLRQAGEGFNRAFGELNARTQAVRDTRQKIQTLRAELESLLIEATGDETAPEVTHQRPIEMPPAFYSE